MWFFKKSLLLQSGDNSSESAAKMPTYCLQSRSKELQSPVPHLGMGEGIVQLTCLQSSFSSTEGTYTRLSSLPKLQTMAALSSTKICRAGWASLFLPK